MPAARDQSGDARTPSARIDSGNGNASCTGINDQHDPEKPICMRREMSGDLRECDASLTVTLECKSSQTARAARQMR